MKLGNKASKVASRVTAEGLIGLYVAADAKTGAVVEVNCETDFVAKQDDFINFVNGLAKLVAEKNPADVAALSELPYGDEGTVEAKRAALVGKIGENMSIRRFYRIATDKAVASYNHGGRIGVIVEYAGDEQIGKDLAMHIAASKPKALDETGVPAEDVEKERSVAAQKAAESGKPAEIVAKMVEGSVAKFLKEVTLLNQAFVKDPSKTVAQMLKEQKAEVNAFGLFIVGEGIEKAAGPSFAEEVAAMSKA